jgi:hypothetical protein
MSGLLSVSSMKLLYIDCDQGRRAEAVKVLEQIYPASVLHQEVQELEVAVHTDMEAQSESTLRAMLKLFSYKPTRLALTAGVGLQVGQLS